MVVQFPRTSRLCDIRVKHATKGGWGNIPIIYCKNDVMDIIICKSLHNNPDDIFLVQRALFPFFIENLKY